MRRRYSFTWSSVSAGRHCLTRPQRVTASTVASAPATHAVNLRSSPPCHTPTNGAT